MYSYLYVNKIKKTLLRNHFNKTSHYTLTNFQPFSFHNNR